MKKIFLSLILCGLAATTFAVEPKYTIHDKIRGTFPILTNTTEYVEGKVNESSLLLKKQIEDVSLEATNYTDKAVNALSAYYITFTKEGAAFPTRESLLNATNYYSGGIVRTPTRNDYAVVLADETHGGAEYRYVYAVADGETEGQWEAQYPIETNDYIALGNKPKINGIELSGDINSANLGLASATDISEVREEVEGRIPYANTGKTSISVGTDNEVNNKGSTAVFGAKNNVRCGYALAGGYGNSISTNSSGSLVAGYNNIVDGKCNIVGGGSSTTVNPVGQNYVKGFRSLVVGRSNQMKGVYDSIVSGERNTSSYIYKSIISGEGNEISSTNSMIIGEGLVGEGYLNSAVVGAYNYDFLPTEQCFVVGVGTSDARRNGLVVSRIGGVFIYGVGGYDGTNPYDANDVSTTIRKIQSDTQNAVNIAKDARVDATNALSNSSTAMESLADFATKAELNHHASKTNSHVTAADRKRWDAKQDSLPLDNGSVDTALIQKTVSNVYGINPNTAAAYSAVALGAGCTAKGRFALSHGLDNKAELNGAHAEGRETFANSAYSHTEGYGTKTENPFEHAEGTYNISHKATTNGTILSVGCGSSDTSRKNAFEVLANGEVFVAGVGGYSGTSTTPPDGKQSLRAILTNLETLAKSKPLEGQTMPANPSQQELTEAVQKIWQALGGTIQPVP